MRPNELSTGGSPGLFGPLLLFAITAGSGWMWQRMPEQRPGVRGTAACPTAAPAPSLWRAWRPRWLLPPSLRRSLADAEHGSPGGATHHVTVMHVDPPPGHADAGTYQPYYVALCSCDHLGPDPGDTVEQAFADARAHSADVDPVVARPLEQPKLPGG